jgi:hypothetical protein
MADAADITIQTDGNGTYSLNAMGPYFVGDYLTITAIPNTGYKFEKFTFNGNDYAYNPASFYADTMTIIAFFSPISNPNPTPTPGTSWWDKLTKTEQNLILYGGIGAAALILVVAFRPEK